MTRVTHLIWWTGLGVLGTLAILSLSSDVWEAYVSGFLLASALYGFLWWRSESR
jgi:hypothetical protein